MSRIKTKRNQGFTLMEIMVVIIVIAVLASVAGPMIGSITDQGRTSATKSKLSALKSAIMAYNSDIGRYPFNGLPTQTTTSDLYNSDKHALFGDNADINILTDNVYGLAINGNTLFGVTNYVNKKWKGPYMDSDPSDFMYDSWGTKIKYYHYNKGIWLHSAGSDQAFNNAVDATKAGYDGDDVVLSVARLKF
ncbi:MAG TPA: prepilin-type N-terminal cleavage/methylation domain-containing protein [Candidatus Ozemobacteraceae bacterium]|nr:prepilin-type N-terminal cleavage/methylation domain-containing protein [Candidatus Ozemobacteraceae bacterium]